MSTKIWTINDIQTAMRVRGSHWWDPDTMRSFGCRICGPAWNGPGGVYFVSSEKPPHGPREYTIRQFLPDTADIRTAGAFMECATRATAISRARRLAGADNHRNEHFQPVNDFDQFLHDLAMHGCPTVRQSQARDLIRLSKRHHKLMEDCCNGREIYGDDDEPLPPLRRVRKGIGDICSVIGCKPLFSGDPRGCTVKLILPDGFANDWGQEGLCVPT